VDVNNDCNADLVLQMTDGANQFLVIMNAVVANKEVSFELKEKINISADSTTKVFDLKIADMNSDG